MKKLKKALLREKRLDRFPENNKKRKDQANTLMYGTVKVSNNSYDPRVDQRSVKRLYIMPLH